MGLFDGIVGSVLGLVGDIGGAAAEVTTSKKAQKRAHAFSAAEAEKSRDFTSSMFDKTTAYNSAEAVAQRDWQEQMRQTQYKTAVGDMQSAGLNPMLAYMQGGAGTPSSSAASVGTPGSAQGSSSSMQTPRLTGMVSNAVQTANLIAQQKNIDADTQNKEVLTDKIEAETNLTNASAGQVHVNTEKLREEVTKTRQEVSVLEEKQLNLAQERELTFAREQLVRAETVLRTESKGTPAAQRALIKAQEALTRIRGINEGLETPRKRNEAAAESSWFKRDVSPYLGDMQKLGISSAQGMKSFKDGQWIKRSWGR